MNYTPQRQRILDAMADEPSGEFHGYALTKRTGLGASIMYPFLALLVSEGFMKVKQRRRDPDVDPPGPARRIYTPTAKGKQLLAAVGAGDNERTAAMLRGQPVPV